MNALSAMGQVTSKARGNGLIRAERYPVHEWPTVAVTFASLLLFFFRFFG